MFDVLVYVVALLASGALLFVHVYNLIMYSDLESDFVNPIDLCQRLNYFVLPEYVIHGTVSVLLLLLCFDLVATIVNALLVAYHVHLHQHDRHWFDPTSIFKDLPTKRRDSCAKLVVYLLSFFFYLYRMIIALIGR